MRLHTFNSSYTWFEREKFFIFFYFAQNTRGVLFFNSSLSWLIDSDGGGGV